MFLPQGKLYMCSETEEQRSGSSGGLTESSETSIISEDSRKFYHEIQGQTGAMGNGHSVSLERTEDDFSLLISF
jgi:hypothetical protein